MSDLFRKKSFEFAEVSPEDKGVSVKKVLELVKFSKYKDEFYKLLKIQDIENDFISIPGAGKLVDTMIQIEHSFEKFDLDSSFQNLEFNSTEKFSITFKNIVDENVNTMIESDEFTAQPIYSSQSDFFSGLFNMNKYADSLISKGYRDLVHENLKSIKEILKAAPTRNRRYRIVRDLQNNYYLRGITSNRYYDYNNNIAVLIGLITLHKEMKKSSKAGFIVQRCEFNESYVRVFFKSNEIKELKNIGRLENIIEVSNDEIKREALRFSCVFSINYGDGKDDKAIYIKPQKAKATILSIKHNVLPETAIDELVELSNYKIVQDGILKDIETISQIKKPDQIKFLVVKKIEAAKSSELSKSKKNILSELKTRVKNVQDLLELLHKIEMLAEEIDAKEYLRYLIYEALVYRK